MTGWVRHAYRILLPLGAVGLIVSGTLLNLEQQHKTPTVATFVYIACIMVSVGALLFGGFFKLAHSADNDEYKSRFRYLPEGAPISVKPEVPGDQEMAERLLPSELLLEPPV